MSKEQGANHEAHPSKNAAQSGEEKPHVSRRSFLKTSVAGALALPVLGCSGPVVAAPEEGGGTSTPRRIDPDDCTENWTEPREWIVADHPEAELQLHVVEHYAPQLIVNRSGQSPSFLFSYNGLIPGPTIRMGGNDVLRFHLVNGLSGNNGTYAFKKGARFVKDSAVPIAPNTPLLPFDANAVVPPAADWLLSEALLYGNHQQHTTNIHTHGLHVSPQHNANGTFSDNVLLRVIPREDYINRLNNDPALPLKSREIAGQGRYEIRLGASSGPHVETHPPGTHWYHPHPHGATYDQVASGMAGFLVVEGDVDVALKAQINGYKERVMLVQRVVGPPPAEGEGDTRAGTQQNATWNTVNGLSEGDLVIVMQPGAIERWRVLNGSVDGQGYIDVEVVKGTPSEQPTPPSPPPSKDASQVQQLQFWKSMLNFNQQLRAYNANNLDGNEVPIHLLAYDGITLVSPQGQYHTREFNSVLLSPANRADILFKAPDLEPGETSAIYTIVGKWVGDATDRPIIPAPVNITIATICVRGSKVTPQVNIPDLRFPDVPDLIKPIADAELVDPNSPGNWRKRQIIYAGWGDASYPKNADDPDCKCAPPTPCNSMVIDQRKFDDDHVEHTMGLGTAEEWTIDNLSLTIYKEGDTYIYGQTVTHETLIAAIIDGIGGGGTFGATLAAKAADHPFHIHQNPFWVTGIFASDGTPLDWNYQPLAEGVAFQPRWQDVIRIPRNGGRVVFRSRFWDYIGEYVNHCHLLNHEDAGMMQTLAVSANPFDADFEAMAPDETFQPFPWPAQDMFDRGTTFISPTRAGQPPEAFSFCDPPYTPPRPSS